MDTFVEAVDTWLENATWLDDSEAPAIAALKIMARKLDQRFSAATMAQFGLMYRHLAKKAPQNDGAVDPLEALLNSEQ